MQHRVLATTAFAAFIAAVGYSGQVVTVHPALACGDSETGNCGDNNTADDAKWLLNRAVAEIKRDKEKALAAFSKGDGGFRTQDLYVFCIGRDGKIDATPRGELIGRDVREMKDPNGKAFGAEILSKAAEGKVETVQYLFPKLGSNVPVPKTSLITRVGDEICGVGYYQD